MTARRRRFAIGMVAAAVVVSVLPLSARATASSTSAPDTGHRILFSSDRAGGSEIFTTDDIAGDVVQVTHVGPRAIAFQGTWSPDGSMIAYVRFSLGNAQPAIRVIAADGTADRRLLRDPLFGEFEPEFSPDGGSLLFDRC